MKKSGISIVLGLVGVGVTLSLLHSACTGVKPPAQGSDALILGERGSLDGAPLPPMQVKFEELGDFPPVGSVSIPLNLELKQNPLLPPIRFNVEEMGDFPPVGTPRLPVKPGIKLK